MPTAAAPLTEAAELHNELVRIDREDIVGIRRIYWRLQQVAKTKREFETRVALLFACVRAGEGAEARRLADDLFGAHYGADAATLGTFAALLSDIGQYERVKIIVTQFLGQPGLRALPAFQHTASIAAIFLGDLDWMRERAELESQTTGRSDTAETLKVLAGHGLLEYFPTHQAIVRDVVRDVQCESGTGVYLTDHDEPEIQLLVRVPLLRPQRAALQTTLREALDAYFASQALPPSAYVGKIVTRIVPHPGIERMGEPAAA